MIGRIKNCMLAIQISYVISNDSWLISSLLDYKKSKKWKWKKWFKSKQEYKNDDELREQIVVSFQGPIDSYTGTDCSKYSNQHQTTFF